MISFTLTFLSFTMFLIKFESFVPIIPSSFAISAIVEMSSLLKKSSFFEAPIDLVNACNIHKTPVYLNTGIIEERIMVVNLAKLAQYFAPIVFGIISEKNRIKIVETDKLKIVNNRSETEKGGIKVVYFD